MRATSVLFLSLFLVCNVTFSQSRYPIIPYPNKLVETEGEFEFKGKLSVNFDIAFKSEIETMGKIFEEEYFTRLVPSKNGNLVVKKNSSMGREEYKLTITKDKILIESSYGTGCFYAFQTIRQLMKLTGRGSYQIATCIIEDSPAYPWRSYMLDEGRKFQGKEVVKKLLNQMALIKMNVFHWHLTEDAGWRIEIKKYPLLTEVGAYRDSSKYFTQHYDSLKSKWAWVTLLSDPNPDGGFYTQTDIKEIVTYATERHITVVPEIEMPGHAIAAISAYPWLSYPGKQIKVFTEMIGITEYAFNVGDPRVTRFLEEVLTEVMALFPAKIIHIGGDEVKYHSWKDNPDVKRLMEREGLQNFADVQVYFTNQISNFLKQKGFRMMGWNEILGNVHVDEGVQKVNSQLAPETIVQFWKGDSTLFKEALAKGYDVVYSRSIHTYLDLPRIILADAYNLSPVPRNITPQQLSHIIGVGCQMWGECTPRVVDVYQNTFPRIAAYSEVGWTKEENKDFARFSSALDMLKRYWDMKGIYFQKE